MFSGPALFVASTFFGLFIGTFVFGFVADKYGRRAIFTFSMLAYCAATLIMAFQTTGFGVCLWRTIAGIGIGVELVTIDTYIAELVPKHMRGRAFAFNQCVQFCGRADRRLPVLHAGAATPAGVGRLALGGGDRRHRRAVRVVPAPRHPGKPALAADPWPAGRGRSGHRADRGRGARRPRRRAPAATAPRTTWTTCPRAGSFSEIWQPPYRTRTIMLMVFQFFQTFGFYGFAAWVPTLIAKQVGINLGASLQYSFIIAIANPFGPLLAMSFADKFERKWQLVGAAVCIGVFGVLFSQQSTMPLLILFGVLITLSNNVLSYSFHSYQSRAVSHPRARPSGRLHLFVQPYQHGVRQLHHRVVLRPLQRHDRRVRADRLRHADGGAVDRHLRAADQQSGTGEDLALRLGAEAGRTALRLGNDRPVVRLPRGHCAERSNAAMPSG